jgi:hypothetical protein
MQKFILSAAVSFLSLVLQNVVSGQITVSGGNPLAGSHIHIGKRRVSSDVSGIIRSENYQQEISKCSFRMLVINLLIHL